MPTAHRFPLALIVFGTLTMLGSLLDFYTIQHSTINTAIGTALMGFGATSFTFGGFGLGKFR